MKYRGTKGQWYVIWDKNATIHSVNMDEKIFATYPTIATINSTLINFEEFRANALLISKAPEMLEMLKNIYFLLENDIKIDIKEIKQLIKEATKL